MLVLLRRQLFTTRRKSTRPARCVTSQFTAQTPARCFSNREGTAMRRLNQATRTFRLTGTIRFVVVVVMSLVAAQWAVAQESEQAGIEQGNYNIKQSIEFGFRFVNTNGSEDTYDTFVNLQQGPRLLDFSTEMRSLNHHGTLFDRLYFSNFGYGGDPNNVSRLRISKNKWYNFDALFRRDENTWNYSL